MLDIPLLVNVPASDGKMLHTINVRRIELITEISSTQCKVHLIDWQGPITVGVGFNELTESIATATTAVIMACKYSGQL